ncbi:enoyl-CoA hydratase/isomerase family protein [Arthrobacter globiformis]|uniref:enoyl-CoA hydratase/isomerase family protein n=1 Tax=Arthrobacter globiformis TaxID=1665 RepID=UPI002791B0B2|nr:enoyl-CoA hydratase/isomerase family protein [Arthrobacter globiformis]MDQ0616658.1 enoyl-CoA hydratase [Arthrobacter globiformis]
MSDDAVYLEKRGPVGHLVLNRPEKHNALRFSDLDDLVDLLHEAEADDEIRVIILRGNGKSFCAGHDYNDALRSYGLEVQADGSKPRRPSQRSRLIRDRRLGEGYKAFHFSLKPVIAQIHGVCTGAGMYLAEMVDLVICSENARFSHAEQRFGLAGNTWHLNTQILLYGPKRAREILLLGDTFDGKEAHALGLANRSVPEAELEATAADWASRVAQHPRDALVTGKAMWQMALESLGGSEQFARGYVGHTLGTNLRFEEDEFNFLKERKAHGTRDAFHERDTYYDK